MERIVIVGGGIVGSCIAYHLALAGAAAAVTVVKPDPTYAFAATPRAVGAIRLQHSLRENVEMSLYGAQVYSAFAEHVRGGKVEFDPQFRRCGYLYQVHGAEGEAASRSTRTRQLNAPRIRECWMPRTNVRMHRPCRMSKSEAGRSSVDPVLVK